MAQPITITISLDDKGGVKVEANIEDRVVMLGLIEVAKATLHQAFAKAQEPLIKPVQPRVPDLVKG